MDTILKWLLIVWPKIPQMLQNLSAQFVCTSQKFWISMKKRLHWASVVRATTDVEIEKILEKYLKIRVFFKK